MPVTLHLDLAEISGRIRFGVTRSHSFFSFLGDPLMRITVRNEVGKGAYKFKDFPQISEYITKKFRAYVHNKIVHPHSHKFRLIWPRNWWPEGTQGEFGGDGEEASAKFAAASSVSTPTAPVPVVTVPANPVPAPAAFIRPSTPDTATALAFTAAEVTDRPRTNSMDYERNNDSLAKTSGLSNSSTGQPSPAAAVTVKADEAPERSKAPQVSPSNANTTTAPVSSTSTTSTATSSYQAMRAKVTQWVHNHSSRRASASDAEDHYHPLSKAVQQAQAQQTQQAHTAAAARRASASEHMKGLMESARQSNMFRPSMQQSASSTVQQEQEEISDEKATEREENEAMFDRMALQSLTSMQRDVLQDNLAWDLEVKNVINKHMDRQRQLQLVNSGTLPTSPVPAVVSPVKAHYVYESDWQEDLEQSTYRTAQRCLVAHHAQSRRRSCSNLETSAGMTAMAEQAVAANTSPETRKRAASKTLTSAMLLESTPVNSDLARCRSYEVIEDALRHRSEPTESLPDTTKLRSYSIGDFRPEVLDAMFRIHLLEPSVRGTANEGAGRQGAQGSGAMGARNTSGKGSNKQRASDDSDFTRGPLRHTKSAYQQRPSLFSSTQSSNSSGGGSAGSSLHGVDIAAKFAEFKAKHLNNRDIAQVFKIRPQGPSSQGQQPPRSHDATNMEDDLGVSSMRDALIDAEDDPTEQSYQDNNATSRGSVSGPSSSAAALKYMSNMWRSKFGSSAGTDGDKGGRGPS